MQPSEKLTALLRTSEIAENDAARALKQVELVAEERQAQLRELIEKREMLTARLEENNTSGRQQALAAGDVSSLAVSSGFAKRLRGEIATVEKLVAEKREDAERAAQRVELAHAELMEARIEKKKVEQLIQNREQDRKLSEIARGERETEELGSRKSKK